MNDGVHAYVFGVEIDCSAENILQYCTANTVMGAHLEWLIEQRTGAIGDEMESKTSYGNGDPPLHLQQPAPKPSIFPSDSDSQYSFMYLCESPESSTLISLIFVAKSEFSRILGHPTMRNATKTSPTPRPTAQTAWERIPSPCGPS
jgi:hypothetical protein